LRSQIKKSFFIFSVSIHERKDELKNPPKNLKTKLASFFEKETLANLKFSFQKLKVFFLWHKR